MLGAKTIAALVKDVTSNPAMEVLDATSNSSVKMKSTEALKELAGPLKAHKGIKKLILTDCEIIDSGCEILGQILRENHTIEELVLEKNKIASAGANFLAEALHFNQGLRTLNLLQQTTKNFGEETLEHFIAMFNDNITLTKITWRLESRKSFMLNKLQTRNVEIKKRKDKGEDFKSYLPDHMKATRALTEPAGAETEAAVPSSEVPETTSRAERAISAPADMTKEAASGGYSAAEAPEAPSETSPSKERRRSSVEDMEKHLEKVEEAVGELSIAEGTPVTKEETPVTKEEDDLVG